MHTPRYYNAYLRESEDLYEKLVEVQSPYILENLKPDTQYEVYMEAVNMHGASEPSERILFSTMSLVRAVQLGQPLNAPVPSDHCS